MFIRNSNFAPLHHFVPGFYILVLKICEYEKILKNRHYRIRSFFMTSVVDNLFITTRQENAITERELRSEAVNGRYYSYEEHKWQSMGWIEWLVRKFFVCFLDSVKTTCLRHSWKAIEKMPTIPLDIKNHIEDLFLDSLYPTNPRSSYSGEISRIFCRIHCENARMNGLALIKSISNNIPAIDRLAFFIIKNYATWLPIANMGSSISTILSTLKYQQMIVIVFGMSMPIGSVGSDLQ